MFGGVEDGSVVWKRIAEIDHGLLGYFLTCHLVIEHYMDEYLKATMTQLDWEKAKLTFGQRMNLLKWEELVRDQKFDPIPAIKHMNTLRNRISHRLEIKLDAEALLPLTYYLKGLDSQGLTIPTDPKKLLEVFVNTCCATFASHLTFQHRRQYPNS
ncbi:hypothetical protein [Variovorax sp. V116]|uniref:hypothetical protein n=1 Tax=Variovorax sp. V116 TaxID=3065953 RepID=UPI0034E88D30